MRSIETLMFVLNTIAKVVDASMDMELQYADVSERYRTWNDMRSRSKLMNYH